MSKVSLIIIHYNTPHYLRTCLDSIFNQTFKNIEVIFIDNNSPDESWKPLVEKEYAKYIDNPDSPLKLKIIANKDNLGYAKAANQGIKMAIENETPADYVVITNPDIIYTPKYFETVLERMDLDPEIASITGKVLKYDFEKRKPTKIIDTTGLLAYKNRRIVDRGQGLKDEGQFDQEEEVFGVSGACPLYRREALEDIKIMDEYLDEDFFMYKEDVDLSWRFLLFGWKNYYYPKAKAYHGRGTGIYKRFTHDEVLKHRNKLSRFQKKYSFKNQRLMEVKNELFGNFLRDLWLLFPTKMAIFAYITIREPYLWASYVNYLKQLPRAIKKRKLIMKKAKLVSAEMQRWFKD